MIPSSHVQTRSVSTTDTANMESFNGLLNHGKSGMMLDNKLSVLVDRMDRIQTVLDNTSTGHFHRAMTAIDIANPAPLGFFAFALATALFMTQTAELTEAATQFLAFPLGIFFGGLTMLLVAMLEILRRNTLGATAFGTYGAFWISVGVYGIIQTAGIFFLQAPKGMKAIFALFGIAAVCFAVVSIAICLMLPVLFINIAVMFFLLAGGVDDKTTNQVAGWWGIVTSGIALYQGLSFLFEDVWGKEILPQFYTKPYRKHAVALFPKISVHDTMAATTGYPKPGIFVPSDQEHDTAFRTPSLTDNNADIRQRIASNV